jgi:exosortase
VIGSALAAALTWAYWPTLEDMVRRWTVDPTYSHGYLVPCFAALLLYARRGMLDPRQLRPSWWGALIVLAGTGLRLASAYWAIYSPDRYSMLIVLTGLCVAAGGWHALRWAWPGIAFLLFMVPLPAGFDRALAGPLQRVATVATANVLQTLGFVAEPDGNVLLLRSGELGVEEACSGLRMFVTFCALSTAVAFLGMRSTWQRVILVASALPLAMVCNVTRIVLTAVVFELYGPRAGDFVHNEVAGWLMILVALALLWVEMKVLGHLFVPAGHEGLTPFTATARGAGRLGGAGAGSA